MIDIFISSLKELLIDSGMSASFIPIVNTFILISITALICVIVNFIAKKIIVSIIATVIKRTKNDWDDILLEKKVFDRLSHFAPAIVIYYVVAVVLADYPTWISTIRSGTNIYMIVVTIMVVFSVFNAFGGIYDAFFATKNKNRSIKGYIQGIKIVIYVFGGILIFSVVFGKSPIYFLTGMGAVAAILMLIFKDTILGLVGGIQLAANDMVRLGDWISMPSKGADGAVIDISLHTVKVQNWNKTISYIPTYSLVSESFSNWRGMEEAGGRRISRSINIDMRSIKMLDDKLFDKLSKIQLISKYLQTKKIELDGYNKENNVDDLSILNSRQLTNIGTLRKYIEEYLKNNPQISNKMTLLVRQLQPSEKGLPIEIYCFSNSIEWGVYEGIQSDIFDHILSIINEFELRVFQSPTEIVYK